MKSPMVTNGDHVADKAGYSDLQVLQSNAGYYVGTTYTDEDGFTEPGSRDSGYFRVREDAEDFLDAVLAQDREVAAEMLRSQP